MKSAFGVAMGFVLLAITPLAAQTDMAGAANGFLAVYGGFHPSDGIPDSAGRARLAPYLSPGLGKLLADGAVAEARFAAKVKDSPPLIEGDLFTSMFEGATAWKLGACSPGANTRPLSGQLHPCRSRASGGGMDRYAGPGEHAAGLAGGRYRLWRRISVRQYRQPHRHTQDGLERSALNAPFSCPAFPSRKDKK